MELILAILIAGPAGYLTSTRRRGLTFYLLAWAAAFPVQTVLVNSDGGLGGLYWVLNAVILAAGIALNLLGSRLGERRGGKRAVPRIGRAGTL